jgi:hypothetical protein
MGVLFWNVAVCEEEEREDLVDEFVAGFARAEDGAEFRARVADMIERHRQMFPELHPRRGKG